MCMHSQQLNGSAAELHALGTIHHTAAACGHQTHPHSGLPSMLLCCMRPPHNKCSHAEFSMSPRQVPCPVRARHNQERKGVPGVVQFPAQQWVKHWSDTTKRCAAAKKQAPLRLKLMKQEQSIRAYVHTLAQLLSSRPKNQQTKGARRANIMAAAADVSLTAGPRTGRRTRRVLLLLLLLRARPTACLRAT